MSDQAVLSDDTSVTPITNVNKIQNCDFCTEIAEAGKLSQPPKLSSNGKIIIGIFGAGVAGVTAVIAPFVLPGLRKFALPYIPASPKQVTNVFTVLKGRSGNLLDIGSGDGRLTITAARRGFKAEGVELNRPLVWYSRWSAWRQGLHSQTKFFKKDLWKTDLSGYNNVIIFGVETMMPALEQKMSQELVDNTAVVACRFPFPSWKPSLTQGEGIDTVWLYVMPITLNESSKNVNDSSSESLPLQDREATKSINE